MPATSTTRTRAIIERVATNDGQEVAGSGRPAAAKHKSQTRNFAAHSALFGATISRIDSREKLDVASR